MVKKYSFLVCLFSTYFSFGQSLGQDSDGFSSILLPSTSINIDSKNNVTNLSFYKLTRLTEFTSLDDVSFGESFDPDTYNNITFNLPNIVSRIESVQDDVESASRDSRLLLGLEITGSSKNGLALIFGEGTLSNSANVNAVIGWHKSKLRYNRNDNNSYVYNVMKMDTINRAISEIEAEINEEVQLLISPETVTSGIAFLLTDPLNQKTTKDKIADAEELLNRLDDGNKLARKSERLTELRDYISELDDIIDQIDIVTSIPDRKFPLYKKASEDDMKKVHKARNSVKYEVFEFNELRKKAKYEVLEELKVDLDNLFEKDTWKTAETELVKKMAEIKAKKNRVVDLDDDLSSDFDDLKTKYQSYINILYDLKYVEEDIEGIEKKNVDFNTHVIYGKAGFIGKSFLYDLENDSNIKDERIVKRDFQGTRFEIGWTHQFLTNNVFGINFSRSYTDNSSRLDSEDYTFKVIDDTVTPNLESSTELKALSGPYDKFDKYQIAADYVRFVPLKDIKNKDDLKKPAELYLLINPYFRHNFYYDSETLKPNTSFGLGLYAFNVNKGSVAGGVFAQADDVFNINRDEPIPFTRQIQIGLVFKYSLESFNPKKD
ncbi:hypothetical protein [Seonamhaeicola sp.]|uniref:hypothetical protein n=1 Tax=Seonamhaeicola sp. TaxID=1912245 RepID=UPI002627E105|nr:hypothetical protein [Seonamhaeicola sp.]